MAKARVKVCGITNIDDALISAEYGADALGFVFWEKSPRYISPDRAAAIIKALPPFITAVGVFVDEPAARVRSIIDASGLGCIQLHGSEPPEECARLNGATGVKIIKAFRVRDRNDISRLREYNVSAYLLDAFVEGVPGGTGHTFNWEIAIEAKARGRVILSGGLNPENIIQALAKVEPYGVDVSSGVEESPGKKDRDKLIKFIKRVKEYEKDA
ncbi:MAG: phosphoribosylanthranilate isomerase [Deltaproteobacteria bacterium]|nr:phosphoribosylanthranilate isomerase [Deltaproteobacteria bacterium]